MAEPAAAPAPAAPAPPSPAPREVLLDSDYDALPDDAAKSKWARTRRHPWHSRAGGGAVHSIKSGLSLKTVS
jgi:hypothetical protein